jgi:hypothetical protein
MDLRSHVAINLCELYHRTLDFISQFLQKYKVYIMKTCSILILLPHEIYTFDRNLTQ